jgi:hypothetical protein
VALLSYTNNIITAVSHLIGGTGAQLVGELDNLTTKIITLLEFFNFVCEVSRLQYE